MSKIMQLYFSTIELQKSKSSRRPRQKFENSVSNFGSGGGGGGGGGVVWHLITII